MNRKRKYRCWLLVFLALDLILMGWLGYRLLDRKIPDQILVDHEDSREVANLLKRPFISFDDAITVDEYKAHRQIKTDSKGVVKYFGESVPVISETKISNLPENGKVIINNNSILKMTESEIDDLYKQIDMNSYVDMLADFASKWHNVLVPS